MPKRIGANKRKARVERKKKIKGKTSGILKGLIRLFVICLVLFAVVFTGIYTVKKINFKVDVSDYFVLNNIQIQGANRLDSLRILSSVNIKKGIKLSNISVKKIESEINKTNMFANIKVHRRFPDALVIKVIKKKPIAIVNTGNVSLMDANGVLFDLIPGNYFDLPVLIGISDTVKNGHRVIVKSDLIKVKSFLAGVQRADENLLRSISQVELLKNNRIKFKLESCLTSVFVDVNNIDIGIKHFSRIYGTLRRRNKNMPSSINLCYNNLAFVKD